jgi:hypothetical protein
MNKTEGLFIPHKAHKQNPPPYQHKVCVCPSETFHTLYPVFSIVAFRKITSAEQTIRSCISSYVELSAKGTARSVSESDRVSDGVGSWQSILLHFFEGSRTAFAAS